MEKRERKSFSHRDPFPLDQVPFNGRPNGSACSDYGTAVIVRGAKLTPQKRKKIGDFSLLLAMSEVEGLFPCFSHIISKEILRKKRGSFLMNGVINQDINKLKLEEAK